MGDYNKGKSITRYPWQEWFNQGIMILRRGEHFEITTPSMISMIRNNAPKYNVRVKVNSPEDGLIRIEVVDKNTPDKRSRRY